MIATIGRVMEQPGRVVVETTRPDAQNLSEHVTVLWQDARRISPEQRRKAYALMGEIAAWSGDTPEHVKGALKVDFRAKTMEGMQKQLFSLSDCDMSTARDFISFVIDFMLEYDVPSSRPLTEYAEDIEAYVYACAMHKKMRRVRAACRAAPYRSCGDGRRPARDVPSRHARAAAVPGASSGGAPARRSKADR